MTFLAAAALLPMLFLQRISHASLRRTRHLWLYILVALVTGRVGALEPWLGVMGLYLLIWWTRPADSDPCRREPWQKVPILGWWAAIAGTWFLALDAPGWIWAWLPTAWGVWAWGCAAAMAHQYWRQDRAKVRGWWGGRSTGAAFLALVLPLLPLWAWPGPLLGLWLSGPSLVAVAALSAASMWRWPYAMVWGPIVASGLLAAALVVLRVPVAGRAAGEWTPRGDTLDTLWVRTELLRHAWSVWTWQGTGPGTTPYRHLQAHARGHLREPTGTLHNEAAQLALEYGIVGILAVALFAWRVAPQLTLGDPWSSAVVSGAVLSVGTMALRAPGIGLIFLLAAAEVVRGSA